MKILQYIISLPNLKFWIIVLVYVSGAAAFGAWYEYHEQKKTLTHVDRNLLLSARTLPYLLAHDFHDRATDARAISLREELKNRQKMSAYIADLDLAYAYTLVLKEGRFYFTAPTVTPEENSKRESWYFLPYDDAPDAFYRAVETRTVQYAAYQDQWGRFRSVAVPLTSPGGNLYLACADYDVSYIETLAWGNFVYAVLTVLPMFLLTLPVLVLFRDKDRTHNRELQAVNRQLVTRADELAGSKRALEKEIAVRARAEKALIEGEQRLRQAQKMEAIGTLAGGIAHDFNNILFPILGYTEMIMMELKPDDPMRGEIEGINTAALRARNLVDQILTFSRQETGETMTIRVQPILKEVLKLIRSTIPADIDIRPHIKNDAGVIHADPTQIHQVIMNLLTNAFHALEGDEGQIMVRLEQVAVAENDPAGLEIDPGPYVCLTVADTGPGIEKEIMEKIFDPFFTTKVKGKGTGMGLSVVHGIVRHLKGAVTVESEPGLGAAFNVYFPAAEAVCNTAETPVPESVPRGSESILLVDDEAAILRMAKQMLTRLGYRVLSFSNSREALNRFSSDPGRFDLVITDLAMPKMNGRQLAAALRRVRPDLPILLCTGFSEKISDRDAAGLGIRGVLKKPILVHELAGKIREVCDRDLPAGS